MAFIFTTVLCLYGVFNHPIIIYQNNTKYIISVGCENFDSLEKAVEEAKKRNIYDEKTHKVLQILLEK